MKSIVDYEIKNCTKILALLLVEVNHSTVIGQSDCNGHCNPPKSQKFYMVNNKLQLIFTKNQRLLLDDSSYLCF